MDTNTKGSTMNVRIVSSIATRIAHWEQDWSRETEWNGELPEGTELETVFRLFNRVTEADSVRLEEMGYRLPSMSVGDIVTLGSDTFRVSSVGFEKLDPPAPCGYCRRCAIHDDPAGCLEVEAWERETLDRVR